MRRQLYFCIILGVLLTVSQTLEASNIQQNIDQAENVTTYHGSKVVDMKSGDQNRVEFYVSFMAYTSGCTKTQCFYGWLENSTIAGAEKGFPSGNASPQPVFEFRTNSESDYEIETPKDLKPEWKQLIQVTCEKMNPKIIEKGSLPEKREGSNSNLSPKYKFDTANSSKAYIPSEMNLSSSDYYHNSSKNIQLENINTTKSHVNESIAVDSHKRVKHRITNYTFSIPSDNATVSDKGEPISEFAGNASTVIEFEESLPASDYTQELQKAKALLADSSNFEVEKASQIAEKRKTVSKDPTIDHVRIVPRKEDSVVKRNNVKSLKVDVGRKMAGTQKPAGNINEETFQMRNGQAMGAIQEAVNDKYSHKRSLQQSDSTSESDSQAYSRNPNRRLDWWTWYEHIQEQIRKEEEWYHNYQIQQSAIPEYQKYSTIDYTRKRLITKRILGHTFTLDFEQYCVLTRSFYHDGKIDHSVRCYGKAITSFGWNSETIQVYDFSSGVDERWDWHHDFSHKLGFGFTVPLPPPVDFIDIHFGFDLDFWTGVGLDASCESESNELDFHVYPYVSIGAAIEGRVCVRLVCVEGGVWVKGQLVRLTTEPRFSLNYNFDNNKVVANIDWIESLSTAEVRLGFFMGVGFWWWWHSWTIRSWTLYGGYTHDWTLLKETKDVSV